MTQEHSKGSSTGASPPEPSTKSQVDIASEVQGGLRQANDTRQRGEKTAGRKATQFDGNPNPERDDEGGVFSPRDDTPAVLPTKEGS